MKAIHEGVDSFQVSFLVLVGAFSIRPLVGEATIVRRAVRGSLRSSSISLYYRFHGGLVAYFRVLLVYRAFSVFPYVKVVVIISGGSSLVAVFCGPTMV